MGNRADRAVRVVIQIVVMMNSGVELRTEEQQKYKRNYLLGYG